MNIEINIFSLLEKDFEECVREETAHWATLKSKKVRGEIQMIPESAYKSSARKNWEILWKNKL